MFIHVEVVADPQEFLIRNVFSSTLPARAAAHVRRLQVPIRLSVGASVGSARSISLGSAPRRLNLLP